MVDLNVQIHLSLPKRARRESPAEKARRWIQEDLDQPGLTLRHIDDTIGK